MFLARARLFVLGTAVAVASCGGESVPPGPAGSTRRLTLRPAPEAAEPEAPARVARYQVFGEVPDWRIKAGKVSVTRIDLEEGGKAGALAISGPAGEDRVFELRLPGVYDPIQIDRLEATLLYRGRASLQAALLRKGVHIAEGSSEARSGRAGGEPVQVRFGPPEDLEPCDELLVRIEGVDRVNLVELALFRDPPEMLLPPLGRPGPVTIEDDWRTAVCLSPQRPLETRFRVERGHALRIDYGLPEVVRGPTPPTEIEAVITTEAGVQRVYNLPFEHDLVVVYSEHTQEYLQERKRRMALKRVKNPQARQNKAKMLARKAAEKGAQNAAAYGEVVEDKPRRPPLDPASVPTGLVDGWISRTLPLEEFEGQVVTARFELIAEVGQDALSALAPPVLVGGAQEKPLMVLITADGHRADHLTADGLEGAIETPWFDVLAQRGMVFEQAWTSSNDPAASLAALFAGRPHHPDRVLRDDADAPSLPGCFSAAGWQTIAVLSSPELGPPRSDLTAGFDQVLTVAEPVDAEEAIETLLELAPSLRNQASFVWVQLNDPLPPYEPPTEFRQEHYPAGRNARRTMADDAAAQQRIPSWAEGITDPVFVENLYGGEVTWIDRRLRPIVESPLMSRSIVVYAGTMGQSLESFDSDRLSPQTLRVPLLITGPKLDRDAPLRAPVALHDLGRTLLALGRVEGELPGNVLLQPPAKRTAEGELNPAEDPRFAADGPLRRAAILRDHLQLTAELDAEGRPTGTFELFDLELDPECEVDVHRALPAEAEALFEELAAWLAPQPEAADASPPPAPSGS